MARKDLRKQITIYPPNGGPGEKHSLLNSRDLITHSGWTTSPQHINQFKDAVAEDADEDQGEQFTPVSDLMSNAKIEDTDEEAANQALLNQPVDTMTLPQMHAYAELRFGTKIDKRLNKNKTLDRLKEIADASNVLLKFSDDEHGPDDGVDNGTVDDENSFPIAEEDRDPDVAADLADEDEEVAEDETRDEDEDDK